MNIHGISYVIELYFVGHKISLMKKLVLAAALLLIPAFTFAGRCSGGANCTACKNCNYCKHCNAGGDCSVCNPDKYNGKKAKPAKKPVRRKVAA